jgi:hypothetical protein
MMRRGGSAAFFAFIADLSSVQEPGVLQGAAERRLR